VESRRARMTVARARPEDTLLALDALPRDARVVGRPALRGDAQLLEHRARVGVREVALRAETPREIEQDLPVAARTPRRLHRGVDLDDAPLDRRRRALVFLVERSGQDDVGVARALGEEELDDGVELELLEGGGGEC